MNPIAATAAWFVSANRAVCQWLAQRGLASEGEPISLRFAQYLDAALADRGEARILEVGGSCRPFLPRGTGAEYVGLDIDPAVTASDVYSRCLVQSVEQPIAGQFDVVFNRFLLEHVRDNRRAVASMAHCLADGGHLICQIPCGWHPYSLATRLVGNRWQRWLIRRIRPETASVTGYPAYYDHCTPGQFRQLLRANGLIVERIAIGWGAAEYFEFCVPLYLAINLFNRVAALLRLEVFASGMTIHARKPAGAHTPSAQAA